MMQKSSLGIVSIKNLRENFLKRKSKYHLFYIILIFFTFLLIGFFFTDLSNFGINTLTWSIILPFIFSVFDIIINRDWKRLPVLFAWTGIFLGIFGKFIYGWIYV